MSYIGNKPANKAVVASDLDPAVITGQTALAVAPADTDEFLISDAGTLKRLDASLGGGGITVADNWRLNADDAVDGTGTDLDTGWEQVDTTGQTNLGSSMTQSSGVFTFPSTGIYFVQLQLYYVNGTGASYTRSIIKHDNGSGSQTSLADVRGYAGSSEQDVVTSSTLFDCQNTSTDKVVFYGGGTVNGNVIAGSTSDNRSAATFIRLGDT